MDYLQKNIGEIWSSRYAEKDISKLRLHWGQSKKIINHITKLICNEPKDSISASIHSKIKSISNNLPYRNAISVGCGKGDKEIRLVESGIVEHFDLYELSEKAIEIGKIDAEKRGFSKNISFHLGDAFKIVDTSQHYDFVYWDNALHHMLDVDFAIRWSKDILSENGCFFMFDYIGPTRFQWSDKQMYLLKEILESLDDTYFLIPDSDFMWKKEAKRSTLEEMIKDDPSEAADSDNIVPAFHKYFPMGTLVPLGGLVYVLGLDGIIGNISEENPLLDRLLKMDALLSKQSHNYYAVAYGFK